MDDQPHRLGPVESVESRDVTIAQLQIRNDYLQYENWRLHKVIRAMSDAMTLDRDLIGNDDRYKTSDIFAERMKAR